MKQLLLMAFVSMSTSILSAQNVGIGTNSPDASSILELSSASKGILIPRLTQAGRIGISLPAQGLMVYQTDLDTGFYFFKGVNWQYLNETRNANLLIYYKLINTGEGLDTEMWTAKHDGTNKVKVNIVLPPGTEFSDDSPPKLSPDRTKIFFALRSTLPDQFGEEVYSSNIDGSGVIKIIEKGANGNYIILGEVY